MNKNSKTKPLVLDGAMGTELVRNGVELPLPIWSADANLDHPDIVLNIHQEYAAAGADIITTNTFRTTTYTYRKAGYTKQRAQERAYDSLMSAVDLARKSAVDTMKVAGSITAIDDCYSPELYPGKGAAEDTFGELVEWFSEAGVDLLLFETMGNFEEIEIALEASLNIEINCWFSLILKDGKHILDGHSLDEAINLIKTFPISCLMLNCNKIETTPSALKLFLSLWTNDWGVYSNLGVTDFDNDYFDIINDSNFKESISLFLEFNPAVIGACCGSTPKHIDMIKNLINEKMVVHE
ncbi:MAG: homocysteine S-methyltransferase family protein [Candidatus Marinimicrobia bacterium]|nr:homocysteine S-methyltransferase family protein [Candidatus Neomarinimicrobiota bacterium]